MTQYDLLFKGGEVIRPADGFRGPLDVAIADGRIAALAPEIPSQQAKEVVDVRGKLVVPGLIDLHTHLGFELHRRVTWAEDVCPRSGVTTAVDMGSTGAFTFPWYKEHALSHSPMRLWEFINISSIGVIAIHTPYYVDHYGEYIDVDDTIRTIEENRDYIRGIKVFASSAMVGEWSLKALEAAREVGQATGLPVAVHISVEPPTLEEVLDRLGPGDIITHSYTPWNQGILDAEGHLRPAVREARERGIFFDLGHGAGSFAFDTARKALDQGFAPDSISTDIYYANVETPVKDLLTTVSKFLNLGMPLEEALAKVTVNPARALHAEELGTLQPGGPADLAVLRLEEGEYNFVDSRKETLTGRWELFCELTVYQGRIIYQNRRA